MSKLKWKIIGLLETIINRSRLIFTAKRPMVFCIGLNKTGTTSWSLAMKQLGFVVASETSAMPLFDCWLKEDYGPIEAFCVKNGQAFQDIPFSLPYTFRYLDKIFPGSKFVLTERNSPEDWYKSLTRYHAKLILGDPSKIPTAKDVQNAVYWRKGFYRDYCNKVLGTEHEQPYKKETLISFYRKYNYEIKEYFKSRPNDFLVLNVADDYAYKQLCDFLEVPTNNKGFPWKNRTE